MYHALLSEIRIEFERGVLAGRVDAQGRLTLKVSGYATSLEQDREKAEKIVHLFPRIPVSTMTQCLYCTTCSRACIMVTQAPLQERLMGLIQAGHEVLGGSERKVEVTFLSLGESFVFVTEWFYRDDECGLGSTWRVVVRRLSERSLYSLRAIPGVVDVMTMGITLGSRQTVYITVLDSLESCLSTVAIKLALMA